jgi:AmmeMemoRadiSam system protein B
MPRQEFRPGTFDVDVAILSDTAMHGTVADPDLVGFDPERRGLLIVERSRSTLVFDRHVAPRAVFEQLLQLARVTEAEAAQVFSVAVQSTKYPLTLISAPQAVRGPDVRPPGVAGMFYPADPQEVQRELDDLLAGDAPRDRWRACLVPHAGWRYSGRIAADVLKRIELPQTIIALGPKHTPHGVEWAVAPHRTWELPTGSLISDPELARALANAIDGLELDAAAHRQEHGVEVELPIIQRLSPGTRVVAIAIGGGNLERCEQFAAGLASVISQLAEPPLLLISSDMNHFASDAENRRLDGLALAELDRLDPDALYHTTRKHHISMCGMFPAVIVLKTLQKLSALSTVERVGYATSADVSGDTSRVVGYAGMLFR